MKCTKCGRPNSRLELRNGRSIPYPICSDCARNARDGIFQGYWDEAKEKPESMMGKITRKVVNGKRTRKKIIKNLKKDGYTEEEIEKELETLS